MARRGKAGSGRVWLGTAGQGMTLDRILRAIARGEPWKRRGQEPGQLHRPLVSNRCQMALTYGPNHKRIKVRCRCMAEYRTRPNYYVYDYLAIVDTLTEAWEVWEDHCNDRYSPLPPTEERATPSGEDAA